MAVELAELVGLAAVAAGLPGMGVRAEVVSTEAVAGMLAMVEPRVAAGQAVVGRAAASTKAARYLRCLQKARYAHPSMRSIG